MSSDTVVRMPILLGHFYVPLEGFVTITVEHVSYGAFLIFQPILSSDVIVAGGLSGPNHSTLVTLRIRNGGGRNIGSLSQLILVSIRGIVP